MNSDPNTAPRTLNLLLIDRSPGELQQMKSMLGGFAGSNSVIHTAENTSDALAIAHSLDSLDAMIAEIPPENGGTVFDLRDALAEKFSDLPAAFFSAKDMSEFYDRVRKNEMLFYKPVDDAVLKRWLGEAIGIAPEDPIPVADDTSAIAPAPPEEKSLPEGLLDIDTELGDYRLVHLIQNDSNFAMYEAQQKSINRRVALKILFRKHRKDPNWVGAFVQEARSRALVTHPDISLVYEADQEKGVNFYTLELIQGASLADLARRSVALDAPTIWRILKSYSSAVAYLLANQMAFRPLSAQTVFLIADDRPRIANPVKYGRATDAPDDAEQMKKITDAIEPFIAFAGRSDPRLTAMFSRLSNPDRADAIRSPQALAEAIRQFEDEHLAVSPHAIAEKETNRTAIVVGGLIGAIIIMALAVYLILFAGGPAAKHFDLMIKIPAGPAVYQESETIDLEEFQIDEYEVTIAQYAAFLADLEAYPEKAEQIRHPNQPETKKSYEPKDWKSIYAKAKKGRKFGGAPIDLNCPVFQVDWWDAYAYSKWKGRNLPTEQQWEKAARGRGGSLYPWGEELDLTKFNSGVDQDEVNSGKKDGFRYWAPVDSMEADESRYGVKGMAGNVSEWTATWDTHPDFPDRKVPVMRGASFATKSNFELTTRRPAAGAEEASLRTGFRTVLNKNGAEDSPAPASTSPAPTPAPAPAAEEPEPMAGAAAAPGIEPEAKTETNPMSDSPES